jgi:hypothetical protein
LVLHPDDRLTTATTTRHRDYILTAYEPRCDPTGKLHAASLLRHVLRQEGLLEAWPLCARLQEHLGEDETVWGFKYGPAGFSLELYFYNFDQNAPGNLKSVTALSEALSPLLKFDSHMDESQPYFMCSFEIDAATMARGDGGHFRVYIRSGDKNRQQCGFSYRLEGDALVLENHYWFYLVEKPGDLEDAVRRVRESPRSGDKTCWSTLLPKYLRECFTICYAVKPRSDSLYYSRVSTAQLARFVATQRPELQQLLLSHEGDLEHLSWDIGFDFAAASSASSLTIEKFGVHGVL